MKNKKGFTLIELLAVIIILGILMIIAIPSVTEYINDSRREAYILTVKEVANSVSQKVNSGEYPFFDKNVTYYIPFDCVEMENGNNSPFGKWKDVYILVNYSGEGYDYYFTGYDEVGYGTTEIVPIETLNKDLIAPGQNNISNKRGVARDNVGVLDKNSCSAKNLEIGLADDKVNSDGTEIEKVLLKDVVQVGDYVNYDAGTWEETKAMPSVSETDTFGGYTKGHSRNESVNCSGKGKYNDGWRVLGVDGDSVVLVHAGTPECFRVSGYGNESLSILKNNNWDKYVNSKYAISSQSIDFDIVNNLAFEGKNGIGYESSFDFDILRGHHFFANISESYQHLVYSDGSKTLLCWNSELDGIRPVVKLKSGVYAKGKTNDAYGNMSWVLVDE